MFHYVELDLYTNLNATLYLLCGALWPKRQTRKPWAVVGVADFIEKANLDEAEGEELLGCVGSVVDFWLTLTQPLSFPVYKDGTYLYRCSRPETRGDTALKQTIRWLNRRGVSNPLVWNEV